MFDLDLFQSTTYQHRPALIPHITLTFLSNIKWKFKIYSSHTYGYDATTYFTGNLLWQLSIGYGDIALLSSGRTSQVVSGHSLVTSFLWHSFRENSPIRWHHCYGCSHLKTANMKWGRSNNGGNDWTIQIFQWNNTAAIHISIHINNWREISLSANY